MEVSSKNSINNDKSLCLYCDKTFANIKDQKNHVEREHKTILYKGKGSRKSERITKNNLTSENSPFPGCFHCNKKIIRTDDLENLFQHLLSSHKDVYFGCKCKIRTQDKVSLATHKKNCKIGGGGKSARCSEENVTDVRKTAKKSQATKNNGDSKCDNLSESEDNVSAAAANNSKNLPANAIHKKSDRSKLKNLSKNASVNDKGKKNKLSSSSSTTSSSSSNKTGEDEYTIPLTRQKLKEPPSRLGAAQNRTAGNKKSHKTNRAIDVKSITISSPTKVYRTKTNKIVNASSINNPEPVESVLKNEPVSFEFDEDFYRNISQNIRLNLASFVDGKSDQLQNRCPMFDHISEQAEACCTTEKKVAIPVLEKEIHEATNFELSTPPFPALLTAEQYGFGDSNPNKNKRQITKNSWKWKWDLIKKYKYVNEGGKIVKKVKQITTGLKDLSQLDMWTQLSMRSRYENLITQNGETTELDEGLSDTLSMRTIKTQNIEQLNTILDKRLTPEIDIEQLQQTVIKLEPEEKEDFCENFETEGEADQNDGKPELLDMFNLVKTNVSKPSKTLLSGEWARPRCYICVDCGLKFDLMKSLNDHKNSEHPYVVSAHYEIVGRENLEQKLYKNLFLPKKALQTSGFARSLSINSDSKSNETNEASTSSDNSSKFFADQKEKECSKCLKLIKYSSDIDIYKHILECIEDRAWMQAKRRSKYRRSRRKSRKTTRKSRLSIDQKKIASSPSTKDNTEGENSTPSISNPPTPKSDPKTSTSISSKINKIEPLLNEIKPVNGKNTESMSIKNFFRVSKTTPIVTQKVVVQMLEIPPTNQSNSLRSSLRSSSAKRSANTLSNLKNNSTPKTNDSQNENVQDLPKVNDVESLVDTCSEKHVIQTPVKNISDIESEAPESRCAEIKNPLIPLTICTPEKSAIDTQLISPTSSSSLVSPTSNSNVPKKKKKLNDCIAMLTCKIQAQLGVNFFDSISKQPSSPEQTPLVSPAVLLPQPVQKPAKIEPSSSFQIESLLKENKFNSPIQDEVIDLSVKKKTVTEELKSDDIIKRTEAEITEVTTTVEVEVPPEVLQAKEKIAEVEKPIVEPNEETKVVAKECLKEKITDLKESENKVEEIPSVPIQNELKIEKTIEVEVKKRLTKRKQVKKKAAKKPSRKVPEVKETKVEILEKEVPEVVEILETPKLPENEKTTECIEKLEPLTSEISQKSEPETLETHSTDVEKILIEEFKMDESLKISIPKEKIPNLKEILDQYQVITVNNIKISESERRAFEEQKNRILQILNKTKNSNNKRIGAKKAAVRKAPMRRLPVRKTMKKKEQIAKSKPETPIPEIEKTAEEIVEAKIEKTVEAIKTTNRIRCRRLSVVVDPIINLSAFQNKNRKIRLTNNSQQNGFYDLLAASEQFFAENKSFSKDKLKACPETSTVVEEVKPEVEAKTEVPEPCVVTLEEQEIVETKSAIKPTRAAKVTAKELILSDKTKETIFKKTENDSPQKPKTKSTDKILTTTEPTIEKPPEPEKLPTTPKKSNRGKKQNVENISTVVVEKEPENVSIEADNKAAEVIKDQPKSARQRALAKNKKKNVLPLEEIKVEQSVKAANVKEIPEKRRKLPRRKSQPVAKEENLLDISFSSDTSNENDIPLAQLIAPALGTLKKQEVEKMFESKEEVELDTAEQSDLKESKIETLENTTVLEEKHEENYELEVVKPTTETPNQQLKIPKAVTKRPTKKKQAILAKTPVKEPEKVEKIQKILRDSPILVAEEEVESVNDQPQILISQETREDEISTEKPVDKFETFLNKTSSMIDLSGSSDVDTKKSFDPFTINEDSFFNDDLDNDPSDKINDIVNNIINSSEFQIDSDTEKSEIYQASVDGKNQPMPSCTICKRTFRTEKVLEKHCMTSTHIMKVQRKHRGIARSKESNGSKVQVQSEEVVAVKERVPSPIFDEAKVFRTKGALKTFDTVLDTSVNEKPKVVEEVKPVEIAVVHPKNDLTREQKLLNANDDKIYYEFKMEKKPEDMTPKDKDQLFDSLFNSLEAKAQEKQTCYTPKPNLSVATPQDSEMESSSTSWDLKHDADIEWEGEPIENVPFAKAIKERYPKKFSVKVNRHKDTAVSIPTKSLIMGKIFKKHRDREIQKTPQANAPNNKPGIKNSLDEIFDHLKNTAEIDDKVLTCPSPKTLLKNAGGTFSPHSSLSNDMLETASQSNNNNIYKSKAVCATPDKEEKKAKVNINPDPQLLNDSTNEDGDDGVGKRKSRRRCAIKAKTFAETWSSDEYEELHDTEDIISIINEIEKRELIKKRKLAKFDSHLEVVKKADSISDIPVKSDSIIKPSSIMKSSEAVKSAYVDTLQKAEKKKSVQILDILKTEKTSNTIKKRRMSTAKDGHKSDEETFTATKDALPLKICSSIKKRRMSCFVPSTPSFVERPKPKPVAKPIKEPPLRIEAETLRKFEKSHEILELKSKVSSVKKSDSEKSFKNQKKFVNLLANFGGQVGKKKVQKHRKRPRNKIKNIAYDSDSDFELNLNKKSRAAAATPAPFSESSSSSSEQDEEDNDDVIITPKPTKSQTIINASRISNTNDMTMIKEPKLLPNDLKHVVPVTTSSNVKAAIPEDIMDPSQSSCNRTKRHSSEKLYYWSSSSSESDQEQGDTADGDNEDSVMPHQPEQHGWIVGASHKKLVTLLAHAKIKNKIN